MRYVLFLALACCAISQAAQPLPRIVRIYPLGGQAGTSVAVELLGDQLSNAIGVKFDCGDLVWAETTHTSHGKLSGVIEIAPGASLGAHLIRVATRDGDSTSLLFNVGQFPSATEKETNNHLEDAQELPQLPIEVQGRLDGAPDLDYFAIPVQAGERWVFDLKAIEHGSAVEARMILLDSNGHQVRFNDDRGDFDENPLIEHTFPKAGRYYVKVDQYRGPRGFNFGKNCAYILRVSRLSLIRSVAPLGLEKGQTTQLRIMGSSLQQTRSVVLTKVRHAEYAHMTYPYTMPIDFRPDASNHASSSRITGKIIKAESNTAEIEFTVPSRTDAGLWRLWVENPDGISESISVEISGYPEYDEKIESRVPKPKTYAVNGALSTPGERDIHRIEAIAGQPLHFLTLAAQLGVSYLDTVMRLRDALGKKLAENDDVVAGQGTLIGNPDSSLYFVPKENGPLFIEVFDRLKRGGIGYEYRLKIRSERPGFQLFTTPENFGVARGGTGEIKVHLIRDAGFEGEVSVWLEGLPPGIEQPKGKFRADQLFEPNADGADMIIPEITFKIQAPTSLSQSAYTLRLIGCATNDESNPDRRLVEGHTAMMLGPLLDVWNFTRRPLPSITMTVVEPFDAKLSMETKSIRLEPGESAELTLNLENVPSGDLVIFRDLPKGIRAMSLGRKSTRETFVLEAATDSEPGTFAVSAEVSVAGRRASASALLTIYAPSALSASQP